MDIFGKQIISYGDCIEWPPIITKLPLTSISMFDYTHTFHPKAAIFDSLHHSNYNVPLQFWLSWVRQREKCIIKGKY